MKMSSAEAQIQEQTREGHVKICWARSQAVNQRSENFPVLVPPPP